MSSARTRETRATGQVRRSQLSVPGPRPGPGHGIAPLHVGCTAPAHHLHLSSRSAAQRPAAQCPLQPLATTLLLRLLPCLAPLPTAVAPTPAHICVIQFPCLNWPLWWWWWWGVGGAGLEEESKVKAADLDPMVFPNAAALEDPAALGRLTIMGEQRSAAQRSAACVDRANGAATTSAAPANRSRQEEGGGAASECPADLAAQVLQPGA